ncbi:Bifunctional purine biosynthesis protein PurH, partial [Coemansia sp. RSA 2523]
MSKFIEHDVQRPLSLYRTSSAAASFASTSPTSNGKKKGVDIYEADEQGVSPTDSRYSRLNCPLLLFAITAAISSINYGWVIGSINIPALVIEECADGPVAWTNGFPSCIPMSSTLWGLVVGLTPLGAWAGSMFSGIAADKFGRKHMLMYNNAFFVSGAIIASTSTSVAQLSVGRFVSGIGCGVAANVVSTYCSEVSTIRSRGFLGGFQQLMILVGVFLSQVVSIGLSKAPLWRVLFSISAAIAIVQTLLLFFIPESPKYLASTKQIDKAEAVLVRLRKDMDIAFELDDLLTVLEYSRQTDYVPQPTMWQVLAGKTEIDLRHLVFSVLFLMLSQQWAGGKGVMFYSTEILSDSFHLSDEEIKHIPTIAQLLTLGIGAVGLFSVILGMCILDKVGRRTVLMVSSLATAISSALIVIGSKVDIGPVVAAA